MAGSFCGAAFRKDQEVARRTFSTTANIKIDAVAAGPYYSKTFLISVFFLELHASLYN